MAKKTRRGQKQCPKCNAWVKGTRAKACPKCDYQFNGKQAEVHVPQAVAAGGEEGRHGYLRSVARRDPDDQGVGGFNRLNELLGLVKEVGGLKKFKDLLEAMSAA